MKYNYKSGWPHAEKMGTIIRKFDFQQGTARGWWLGGLRETGFLSSGGVTWTKDAVYEGEWEDKYHPRPADDDGRLRCPESSRRCRRFRRSSTR